MVASTPFTSDMYAGQTEGSRRSADAVVPRVIDLVGQPGSVLDAGCGAGEWLASFGAAGVGDLVGLEGGHPRADQLQVAPDVICATDLQVRFDLGRSFDLVVSLEVAEHLPEASAAGFVSSLCRHGDVVLFSAAVPGQGGTHHVNEQWPTYWADLFTAEGYGCFDVLRQDLWTSPEVEWWYRQNLLLFAGGSAADRLLAAGLRSCTPRSLVHPVLFQIVLGDAGRKRGLRESIGASVKALGRRLRAGAIAPPTAGGSRGRHRRDLGVARR